MTGIERRYQERLERYTTALRNEMPDRVPIRPFAAEFTGVYAGYTCQQLAHDYENAFAAVRKCAADFDWDAVVPNMLATWTGMTQAIGLKYYMTPGIDLPADVGHREPAALVVRTLNEAVRGEHLKQRAAPYDRTVISDSNHDIFIVRGLPAPYPVYEAELAYFGHLCHLTPSCRG